MMTSMYISNGSFLTPLLGMDHIYVWNATMKSREVFGKGFKFRIGNGNSLYVTMFLQFTSMIQICR